MYSLRSKKCQKVWKMHEFCFRNINIVSLIKCCLVSCPTLLLLRQPPGQPPPYCCHGSLKFWTSGPSMTLMMFWSQSFTIPPALTKMNIFSRLYMADTSQSVCPPYVAEVLVAESLFRLTTVEWKNKKCPPKRKISQKIPKSKLFKLKLSLNFTFFEFNNSQ